MGRFPKSGVDYFPHDVTASSSPSLFVLQEKYGNDGYAFWFKLLEFLGRKSELYADFSEEKDWLYFLSVAMVQEEKASAIMNDLIKLKAIDEKLWTERRIVWCENFVERLSLIYKKRGVASPSKPTFKGEEEEAAPPKAVVENQKPKKKKYADLVLMKPSEYDSLVSRIGEAATKACIARPDDYKGSKGVTYKDDYRAILSWVIDAERKKNPHLFKTGNADSEDSGANPFGEYK